MHKVIHNLHTNYIWLHISNMPHRLITGRAGSIDVGPMAGLAGALSWSWSQHFGLFDSPTAARTMHGLPNGRWCVMGHDRATHRASSLGLHWNRWTGIEHRIHVYVLLPPLEPWLYWALSARQHPLSIESTRSLRPPSCQDTSIYWDINVDI